jgi:gamma-glutamylcyclotransferase (GGCT)/AIG2-like uncharacterized protein YtfP
LNEFAIPYLFVYGTLRADSGHAMASVLATLARRVGPGSVAGRLYDLGAYPGLVEPLAEGERVRGEVYELADPERALVVLDRYEGCGPEEPPPWLFVRRPGLVALANGGELTAWVYEYRGLLDTARHIPSGDYLAAP